MSNQVSSFRDRWRNMDRLIHARDLEKVETVDFTRRICFKEGEDCPLSWKVIDIDFLVAEASQSYTTTNYWVASMPNYRKNCFFWPLWEWECAVHTFVVVMCTLVELWFESIYVSEICVQWFEVITAIEAYFADLQNGSDGFKKMENQMESSEST